MSKAIDNIVESLNCRLDEWIEHPNALVHKCGIKLTVLVVCEPGHVTECVLYRMGDTDEEIPLNENDEKKLHIAYDSAINDLCIKRNKEKRKIEKENREWLEEVTKGI